MLFFVLSLFSCASDAVTSDPFVPPADTGTMLGSEQLWYVDADGDGHGDENSVPVVATYASGLVANGDDCNDSDAKVYAGRPETCNDVDDNCNGFVDEHATNETRWFLDGDGDGFGDATISTDSCDGQSRFVADATDCDDTVVTIHPTAEEFCNDVDDNCDGAVDENPVNGMTWYADADNDGYGTDADASTVIVACERPNLDVVNGNTDCDDADAEVHPSADELCNEVDDDCDGDVDENPVDGTPYYMDLDLDGYGGFTGLLSCTDPGEGYSTNNSDCSDSWSSIHPDAEEYCDGMDNDCDGQVDEDIASELLPTWYFDGDHDGYGDPSVTEQSCFGPVFYVPDGTDCDDTDMSVVPGFDNDRDGYSACFDDCDDLDHSVYPGATEYVNGVDDDCDGETDEATSF